MRLTRKDRIKFQDGGDCDRSKFRTMQRRDLKENRTEMKIRQNDNSIL